MAFMNDRCAVNLCCFKSVLSSVFMGSNKNDCLGHSLMHVCESIDTPTLDLYFALYNTENAHSNRFRRMFEKFIGFAPLKESGTRWYGELDARVSCEAALANG